MEGSEMATFSAYVNEQHEASISEVLRAMSSRGWRVDIAGEEPLHARTGALAITIENEPVTIELSVLSTKEGELAEQAAALASGGDLNNTMLRVLKKTDYRISFVGSDEKGDFWSRVLARNLAILSVGAFESSVTGKLLYYAS
jgi:hypothetical protein